jgi:hypothetical protein
VREADVPEHAFHFAGKGMAAFNLQGGTIITTCHSSYSHTLSLAKRLRSASSEADLLSNSRLDKNSL